MKRSILIAIALCACGNGSKSGGAGDASEAQGNLGKIQKAEKAQWVESVAYVPGHAGPTPPATCCAQPGKTCKSDPSLWESDPVWSALDFAPSGNLAFQYSYASDGKTLTVIAQGDPGCTGKPVTVTLTGTIDAQGGPAFTVEQH